MTDNTSIVVFPNAHAPLPTAALSAAPVGAIMSDPVKYAIREVLIAFPSQNISSEERTMLLGVYRDAVQGFEEELVVSVLRWLRFNNPRNTPTYTQPPTAQDVHAAITSRRKSWAVASVDYFCGAIVRDKDMKRVWKRSADELPCSHGLAAALLIEKFANGEWAKREDEIHRMPDEAFDALPDAIFTERPRDEVIEERRHRAYLRAMDDIEYHTRRLLLLSDRRRRNECSDFPDASDPGPQLTEETLMERVRDVAARFREKKKAEGGFAREGHELTLFVLDGARGFSSTDFDVREHDLRCIPWPPPEKGPKNAVASIVDAVTAKLTEAS